MENGFFIKGVFDWGKKVLYLNTRGGFHNGRSKSAGYTSYSTEAKAKKALRHLKLVFDDSVVFEVLPDSELPFIKRQQREWKQLFNTAAKLVVSKQKSGAKFLMDQLQIPVHKALLLMDRLHKHEIVGEPYCKKDENFWQKQNHVARRVKIKHIATLEKKLKFIHKHKLL